MLDYVRINHETQLDRLKLEAQLLQDRLNAWDIWFGDLCVALGLAMGDYVVTPEDMREVLDAVKDLKFILDGLQK